jgi:hypothetical protein
LIAGNPFKVGRVRIPNKAKVLDLLRRPQGSTIPVIIKATGWQQHSVRGFFAGVVRKKLGLTLQSEKPNDGHRIYRIVASVLGKAKTKNDPDIRRMIIARLSANPTTSSSLGPVRALTNFDTKALPVSP